MARAGGVSKTAPSATKAFCMSMTIRAQLRGSMVKKFFPEALGLDDMGLSLEISQASLTNIRLARFVEDQLVLISPGVRCLTPNPACPPPGVPRWLRAHPGTSSPGPPLPVAPGSVPPPSYIADERCPDGRSDPPYRSWPPGILRTGWCRPMSEEPEESQAGQRSGCRHARNPDSQCRAAGTQAAGLARSCIRMPKAQKPRLPWHAHASRCAPRKTCPPDQALPAWDRYEERRLQGRRRYGNPLLARSCERE